MASQRITIFPKTSGRQHEVSSTNVAQNPPRRVYNGGKTITLELTKSLNARKSPQIQKRQLKTVNESSGEISQKPSTVVTNSTSPKVYTPEASDPSFAYEYLHTVEGIRPFCLAQERKLPSNDTPYRIVMVRRGNIRTIVGTGRAHPNLLNIIQVFEFYGSLFTIFNRPGFPLSDLAPCPTPKLDIGVLKTISKEVILGLCALVQAGFTLKTIRLQDVSIAPSDGQVKVEYDTSTYHGPEADGNAGPLGTMLRAFIDEAQDPAELENNNELQDFIRSTKTTLYRELSKASFLQNALPSRSLVPWVLNASVLVDRTGCYIQSGFEDLAECKCDP